MNKKNNEKCTFRNVHGISWTIGAGFLFVFKACQQAHSKLRNCWHNAENGQKYKSIVQVIPCTFLSTILLYIVSFSIFAETKIAILDFELKDLTLAPRIPSEVKRTASIKLLLETELKKADYAIINIDPESQKKANGGIGYLFDHHDIAAKLGKQFGADYVLVGRLHKPSFLFAYLMGHLVRVSDEKLIGNYISEAKGPNKKLTIKTVESLAVKIDKTLDNRYSPPMKQLTR